MSAPRIGKRNRRFQQVPSQPAPAEIAEIADDNEVQLAEPAPQAKRRKLKNTGSNLDDTMASLGVLAEEFMANRQERVGVIEQMINILDNTVTNIIWDINPNAPAWRQGAIVFTRTAGHILENIIREQVLDNSVIVKYADYIIASLTRINYGANTEEQQLIEKLIKANQDIITKHSPKSLSPATSSNNPNHNASHDEDSSDSSEETDLKMLIKAANTAAEKHLSFDDAKTDIFDYLDKVDNFNVDYVELPDKDRIKLLTRQYNTSVKRWFAESLKKNKSLKNDMKELLKSFADKYFTPPLMHELYRKYDQIKMTESGAQALSAFINRFDRIVERLAWLGMINPNDRSVCLKFVNALPAHLHTRMLNDCEDTIAKERGLWFLDIDSLKELASTSWNQLQTSANVSRPLLNHITSHSVDEDDGPSVMLNATRTFDKNNNRPQGEIYHSKEHVDALIKQFFGSRDNERFLKRVKEDKCYLCGGIKHRARNCRSMNIVRRIESLKGNQGAVYTNNSSKYTNNYSNKKKVIIKKKNKEATATIPGTEQGK